MSNLKDKGEEEVKEVDYEAELHKILIKQFGVYVSVTVSDSHGWAYRVYKCKYPHDRIAGGGNFDEYNEAMQFGIANAVRVLKIDPSSLLSSKDKT